MVGLGAVPGILQLSSLHLLPESRESAILFDDTSLFPSARLLILRGQPERARSILARIYPSASPSTLAGKVDDMIHSVHLDTSTGQISLKGRMHKLFYIGSNRRALGRCGFSILFNAELITSRGSWIASDSTALRLQYPYVLFRIHLCGARIQECYGCRAACRSGQLRLHHRRSPSESLPQLCLID
jgi:hypothetical protein